MKLYTSPSTGLSGIRIVNQNGLNDHKAIIICPMVDYGEANYGRHKALNASCSEVK